ncbi:MAG: hypothetical protein HDS59_08900 [Barnesiella sp.]|nr:hypothetical protein [Barnesiella sp.]
MKNFTFALKWHEILKSYSEEIRKEVYFAAIEYAATGKIPDIQPLARMAFDFIKYEIDEKMRRREARLAKKAQKEASAANETAENTKPADNNVEKIIDTFYSQGRVPEPVTVTNAGVNVSMSKERIRDFVRVCVKDIISKGHNPEKDNTKFMATLGSLVSSRYEVLRQDLLSRRPTQQFTDEQWTALLSNAHKHFAA